MILGHCNSITQDKSKRREEAPQNRKVAKTEGDILKHVGIRLARTDTENQKDHNLHCRN